MPETKLSVVIPVFNNLATLPRVLALLEKQRVTVPHEVVAVDNGSTDGSVDFLKTKQKEHPDYLTLLFEERRGAGTARNRGAVTAKAPIVLFLGGDIYPAENLLTRHLEVHQKLTSNHVGCLGYVTWDPTLPPSPLMVFLENGGPQNAFGEIAGREFVDPAKYFYGSNISLKKKLFDLVGGFDTEHFSGYGWEDLDLGVRLKEKGFKLFYEPQARGTHHHNVSLTMIKKRMFIVGQGFVVFKNIHPQVGGLDLKREQKKYWLRYMFYNGLAHRIISGIALWCEYRCIARWVFRVVISLPFYNGVHTAMIKQKKSVDKPVG